MIVAARDSHALLRRARPTGVRGPTPAPPSPWRLAVASPAHRCDPPSPRRAECAGTDVPTSFPTHSLCGCRQATKFCCLPFFFSVRFQNGRARDVSPSSATTRRLDARVDIDSGDPVTHRWPAPEPLLSHHPLPTGGEERAGQWARSTGVRATGRRPIGEAARRRGRRRARRRRRQEVGR